MREYKERLRLESQSAVGTSGFHPLSLWTGRKYDPLSYDVTQGLVEDQPSKNHQSSKNESCVTGLVEDQPSKNHQSSKDESCVIVQEQGAHGVSP